MQNEDLISHATMSVSDPCVLALGTDNAQVIAIGPGKAFATASFPNGQSASFEWTVAGARFVDPETCEHVVVIDNSVPATYDQPGLTEGSHCEICGKIIVAQKNIPVLGILVLPEALINIADEAFKGLPIKEVILGDKIASIGERAFADCKDLCRINLPDGVQIGKNAFTGCDQLIIVCTEGSSAQRHAELYEIPYVIK